MNEPIIRIQNVSKHYDGVTALENINLDILNGEFLTLLGPSGCGKTTLLRMIAGFEIPDEGKIFLANKDITNTLPEHRNINMVFQNYALFPHMTVYDNIAFGLRCRSVPENEVDARVNNIIEMVDLVKLSNRKPTNLSGGQQQRVALARAVVNKPSVLLLDEPFSALDYSLRKNMRIEVKELQQELGITFIFVTHDQEEALTMSDRIVIINEGGIVQIDTARHLYEEPKSLFAAKFIGEANIFETQVISADNENITVEIEKKLFILANKKNHQTGDKIYVILRPEDIKVWERHEISHHDTLIAGTIDQIVYKGSTVDLIVSLPSGKKLAATEFFNDDDPNLNYTIGEQVWSEWFTGWEVTLAHEDQ